MFVSMTLRRPVEPFLQMFRQHLDLWFFDYLEALTGYRVDLLTVGTGGGII